VKNCTYGDEITLEDKEQVIKLIDENVKQIEKLIQETIKIWSDHIVFSGLWWLAVFLTIVPWIIWMIFRIKSSSDRILYAGFFVMIISICLDAIGNQYGFWTYRYHVMPIFPAYLPWDITLMPVTAMFFLQIKPNGNPFFKAILFAILAAYIAEPFFHWIGIYNPKHWKYIYSVPLHIIIYLIAHYLTRKDNFSRFYHKKGI
jgi:hypothetical protein